MRALLLAASLLAATASLAAPATPLTPPQAEALLALARTYGVVRYFHPSDAVEGVSWDRFLVHAAARMHEVGRREEIAPRLEALFAPVVEGFRVAPQGASAAAPQGEGARVEWRHLGYGLEPDATGPYASWRTHHDPVAGGGVKGGYFQHRAEAEKSVHDDPVWRVPVAAGLEAHVPVSLPASAAKVGEAQRARLDALAKSLAGVALAGEEATRAQAHADGIALWNVARHFYPYWDVVKADWEAELARWLAAQPSRQSRAELRDALRRLAAPLDDGHATVADPAAEATRAFLPVSVRPLDARWVIDASRDERLRAGDVIETVDGRSAAQWFADRMARLSGSPQYKRWRAGFELMAGPKGEAVALGVARGGERHAARLAYESAQPLQAPRPPAIHEVRPGIHYVDVSRFSKAAFDQALDALKGAKGIVFDLRGYPAKDAFHLAAHWVTGEDRAQWMFVPRFDRPGATSSSAWSIGWQARRDEALARPAKVLLVDGRAMSYAESLAAYFPDQRVGPVVGEPTAGANGNVARARLPSGMAFFFTGMRVTRHDGATLLHLAGIRPDVEARPSLAGLRAGRDEVLERAIAVIEAR